MSTVVVGITASTNSTGPYGTGTGNGYWFGSMGGSTGPVGVITTIPDPPVLQGSAITALAESVGGLTTGLTICIQGAHPQNYFTSLAFNATTVLSSAATYSQFTVGPTTFTRWIWAATTGVIGSSGSYSFTITYTVPASITLTVPSFTSTEAILAWTSSGGDGVYTVTRNGTLIATLTGGVLAYIDITLAPSTVYAYQIAGKDSGGGAILSNTVTITTADLTDEFNCACETVSAFSTLAQLRLRMLIQVGYAASAANPPPGSVAEINEYLYTAQKQLYDKYKSLRTERMFKWTMVPGNRYYSLTAAEGSCVKQVDPKRITWVGFEDLNQAWYQLVDGINPLWYTRANITTGWPTRYEIRSCIELFPAPQAAYTLWIKAHFQLEPFVADSDRTSIDDELVLLFAVANYKSAKGKTDWQRAMNQATSRLQDLTAANHMLRRYVPGTSTDSPATPPRFLPLNGAPP